MSTDMNNCNNYCENNVGPSKKEEESLFSVEVRMETYSILELASLRGKEKKARGFFNPPCVRFFPQLHRLLTERKVYMKSPELTEISAKHTFTDLQYLSISQSEVVVGGLWGGGANSSCAKSNYARRCNVTAHKRLFVRRTGREAKKPELYAMKISVRQQLGRR